jgi:hypothetical protein
VVSGPGRLTVLAFMSLTTVPPAHIAVVTTFGSVSADVLAAPRDSDPQKLFLGPKDKLCIQNLTQDFKDILYRIEQNLIYGRFIIYGRFFWGPG